MSDYDGVFWIIRTEENLKNAMDSLSRVEPSEDKPWAMKCGPYKVKRTDLQNRYLWGWIYAKIEEALSDAGISIKCENDREVPYTKDILHEIFKGKFLILDVIETKKSSLTMYKSTKDLETDEFSAYCASVKDFVWSFWKIQVPEPRDVVYAQYAQEMRRFAR